MADHNPLDPREFEDKLWDEDDDLFDDEDSPIDEFNELRHPIKEKIEDSKDKLKEKASDSLKKEARKAIEKRLEKEGLKESEKKVLQWALKQTAEKAVEGAAGDAVVAGGLLSNPVGWTILGIIAIVLLVFFIIGVVMLISFGVAGIIDDGSGTEPETDGTVYVAPENVKEYCKIFYTKGISDSSALKIYGRSSDKVSSQLVRVPFKKLSGADSISVHKLAAPCFEAAIKEIESADLNGYRLKNSGTFSWRCNMFEGTPINGCSTSMSNHSFGIAIDLNAGTNGVGAGHGDIPKEVVTAFKNYGFGWGGDWSSISDPMHFEWLGKPNKKLLEDVNESLEEGSGLNGTVPKNFATLFYESAKISKLDPAIVAAIYLSEHNKTTFGKDIASINAEAKSCQRNSYSATGPMQIIDGTWNGYIDNLERAGIKNPDRCKYRDSIIAAGMIIRGKIKAQPDTKENCKIRKDGTIVWTNDCVRSVGRAYCGACTANACGGKSNSYCERTLRNYNRVKGD